MAVMNVVENSARWVMSSATKLSCLMRRWAETDPEMKCCESSWQSAALLKNSIASDIYSHVHYIHGTLTHRMMCWFTSMKTERWLGIKLSEGSVSICRVLKNSNFQPSGCSKQSPWQIVQQCLKPPFQVESGGCVWQFLVLSETNNPALYAVTGQLCEVVESWRLWTFLSCSPLLFFKERLSKSVYPSFCT